MGIRLWRIRSRSSITKKRCTKCNNAYSNIRPSCFPQLYPKRAANRAASKSKQQTVPSNELMFSDKNALRCYMHKLIQLAGYDANLSTDAEVTFVGKALKLNRQHTFDINDDQVFVAHVGEGYNSCFIKKNCANVSTSCKKLH